MDPFDSPEKSHSAAKTRKYSACSWWVAIFSSWSSIRCAEIGMLTVLYSDWPRVAFFTWKWNGQITEKNESGEVKWSKGISSESKKWTSPNDRGNELLGLTRVNIKSQNFRPKSSFLAPFSDWLTSYKPHSHWQVAPSSDPSIRKLTWLI